MQRIVIKDSVDNEMGLMMPMAAIGHAEIDRINMHKCMN